MQAIQTCRRSLSGKSLDQLETDLISLSQHINASEYEFLVLLREFDLRQGWKPYLFNNCAEWQPQAMKNSSLSMHSGPLLTRSIITANSCAMPSEPIQLLMPGGCMRTATSASANMTADR